MTNLQEQVQQRLDELVATELGLQVAVYQHGDLVVDAVAGQAIGPDTLFYSASTGKGATASRCNQPDHLAAETPSAGVLAARGIARLYAALIGEVDGVRLIRPERVAEITGPVFTGQDELLGNDASLAMGYGIGRLGSSRTESPTTFGMPGMGGSAASADTRSGVAFALTRRLFDPAQSNSAVEIGNLVAKTLC